MFNYRDAFSHSEQCDKFSSVISLQIGGVEHSGCQCWCHNAQHLFATPEPEYDFSPPPEYLSSADRAFILDEPAHVRVGFSQITNVPSAADIEALEAGPIIRTSNREVGLARETNQVQTSPFGQLPGIDIYEGPANKAGFSKWSRKELTLGKCETCGDKLADCECVE